MIIERAQLFHVSMPLVRRFQTSFGIETNRECVLVRLFAGDHEGWGECPAGAEPTYSYETAASAMVIMQHNLLPRILGKAILGVDDLGQAFSPFRGNPMAKAGIEMALWDLWGRRQRQSLQSLLGGQGESLAVGISIGIQADVAELTARIDKALADGYGRVKLKIKPGWDLEPLEAVRLAWPDLKLWADANAAYEVGDMDHLKEFDRFELGLLEQPLNQEDLLGHQRLQASLTTPVCLDESILGIYDAQLVHELDACRVINLKAARVGGLTRAIAIHDFALGHGIPLWCGGLLETGIGRAANLALASLPGFELPGDISASDLYYEVDIASPRFVLEDGRLRVPQGGGLAVDVDIDAVHRFTHATVEVEAD